MVNKNEYVIQDSAQTIFMQNACLARFLICVCVCVRNHVSVFFFLREFRNRDFYGISHILNLGQYFGG